MQNSEVLVHLKNIENPDYIVSMLKRYRELNYTMC